MQLYDAITKGDDALAFSIVRGGVDVNGEWDGCTHLYAASRYFRRSASPKSGDRESVAQAGLQEQAS
jgi:hypothetical protein